jgi:hypothetical protein
MADSLIVEYAIRIEGAGGLIDEMGEGKVRSLLHKQFQAISKEMRKRVGHTDVDTAVRKDGGAMVATMILTIRNGGRLLDEMTEDRAREHFDNAFSPIRNLLRSRLEMGVEATTTVRRVKS